MTDVAEGERRILVAVDEGEESMHALSWCLKNVVAQNSKDSLILLYAKPPRAVFAALDGTGYLFSSEIWAAMEKYAADVADCVMEKAKKTCRDLKQDVKLETRVEDGDPRDVICQMAEQLRADVLVAGSHGYGGIKRAFLGSVSIHCAQNVKCPVLIVKKPKQRPEANVNNCVWERVLPSEEKQAFVFDCLSFGCSRCFSLNASLRKLRMYM